jgi:hypothetical protein
MMIRDPKHRKGHNSRVRPDQKAVKGRFGLWRFEEPRSVWQNDEMVTKRTVGGVLSGFGVVALAVAVLSFGGGEAELRYDTIAPPSSTEPRQVMEPPRRVQEVVIDPIASTTTTTTTTTTMPTVVLPPETPCDEWAPLALKVGWPAEELPKLMRIMYRESRCNWDSHNLTDPVSGSRGLLQVNGYWCRPSQYTAQGWLQDRGVLNVCDDLFVPEVNLQAGLLIWLYGEEKHGCGWGPWAMGC